MSRQMKSKYTEWAISGILFLLVAVMFAVFASRIKIEGTSLAIDWYDIWHGLRGPLNYEDFKFRNAPWSIFPLLILGQMPMKTSWGLMMYLTLAVLIASVPVVRKKKLYWASILLTVASFPALRQYADGNVEAVVIGGILLSLYGYAKKDPLSLAFGILFATSKPQVAVLFLACLGLYMLLTFSPRLLLRTGVYVLIPVALGFLWRGPAWIDAVFGIPERHTVVDMSLMASLERLGVPDAINWILWAAVLAVTAAIVWFSQRTLSRYKAGMLVAASLLIAPYSVGNSVLTLLAVALIPLFQQQRRLGVILLILVNLPIVMHSPDHRELLTYYNTALVLVIWGVLLWKVWRAEIDREPSPARALAESAALPQ